MAQENNDKKVSSPPPSADINYTINALQRGLTLSGTANVQWRNEDGHYSVKNETRASIVGRILETSSTGLIEKDGIAPRQSIEKRFRKAATTTTFDPDTRHIRFDTSDTTYPIKGGEQDRNSVVWQLATIARSSPSRFKPGSTIPLVVAGSRNVETWSFKIGKNETIQTGVGSLKTVKVSKEAGDKDKDQRIDIWFAPAQKWYPVRIRFAEPDGSFIEQTVADITPQ